MREEPHGNESHRNPIHQQATIHYQNKLKKGSDNNERSEKKKHTPLHKSEKTQKYGRNSPILLLRLYV